MSKPALLPLALTVAAGTAGYLLQVYASGGFAQIAPGRIPTVTAAILTMNSWMRSPLPHGDTDTDRFKNPGGEQRHSDERRESNPG